MPNRPNAMDTTKMESDLFLEMLEVYINSILYLREVYPSAIFRRRRIYNTTAYISIFPSLNKYLLNALKTAQELKAINKLFQVELIIYKRESQTFDTPDNEEILERYTFRVEHSENEHSKKPDIELYILKFEEDLRQGLMQLEQTAKNLSPLNRETCGFFIQLETTEKSFVNIVTKENSKVDNFPWTLARDKFREKSWDMQPVLEVDPFSLLILTPKEL
ncbi:mitotic spindle assembly checkpoint protein MAD2B [Contarinia nasturtii]|uniref:mitotic spindle assembly checkpoint protein MAD2B n=1 Tax=Contarinia nasturtii TaxID=265458 RepID=UPI0012D3E9AD|nr:mitotic spindle assembly checkpoint protein MAD2B [Contarinia nasturtii]